MLSSPAVHPGTVGSTFSATRSSTASSGTHAVRAPQGHVEGSAAVLRVLGHHEGAERDAGTALGVAPVEAEADPDGPVRVQDRRTAQHLALASSPPQQLAGPGHGEAVVGGRDRHGVRVELDLGGGHRDVLAALEPDGAVAAVGGLRVSVGVPSSSARSGRSSASHSCFPVTRPVAFPGFLVGAGGSRRSTASGRRLLGHPQSGTDCREQRHGHDGLPPGVVALLRRAGFFGHVPHLP